MRQRTVECHTLGYLKITLLLWNGQKRNCIENVETMCHGTGTSKNATLLDVPSIPKSPRIPQKSVRCAYRTLLHARWVPERWSLLYCLQQSSNPGDAIGQQYFHQDLCRLQWCVKQIICSRMHLFKFLCLIMHLKAASFSFHTPNQKSWVWIGLKKWTLLHMYLSVSPKLFFLYIPWWI